MSDRQWHDDEEYESEERPAPGQPSDAIKGFLIASALQAVCGFVCIPLFLPAVVFIGITQLLWMVPAMLFARSRGCSADFLKGMGLNAVIVFLLNAACFGLLAAGMLLSGPWYG